MRPISVTEACRACSRPGFSVLVAGPRNGEKAGLFLPVPVIQAQSPRQEGEVPYALYVPQCRAQAPDARAAFCISYLFPLCVGALAREALRGEGRWKRPWPVTEPSTPRGDSPIRGER